MSNSTTSFTIVHSAIKVLIEAVNHHIRTSNLEKQVIAYVVYDHVEFNFLALTSYFKTPDEKLDNIYLVEDDEPVGAKIDPMCPNRAKIRTNNAFSCISSMAGSVSDDDLNNSINFDTQSIASSVPGRSKWQKMKKSVQPPDTTQKPCTEEKIKYSDDLSESDI
jgi:hypothetical protein